jgi:pimeloyl-ACP methyl ester carboxylesterase
MFVHGSFGGSSVWRRLLARLDQGRVRTIALDLPGWGLSDAPPDEGHVVHHQAAAVEAVMKAIGEPVHLVAHSHGGTVALLTAIAPRIPPRSLTLFEPLPLAVLAGRDDLMDEMRRFLKDYRTAWEAGDHWAVARVFDLWVGPGTFQAMSAEAREAAAVGTVLNIRERQTHFELHIPLDAFRALTLPTTIVVTERGHHVARAVGEGLHRLVPQSVLVEMPGASHTMIHTHAADTAIIVSRAVGLLS